MDKVNQNNEISPKAKTLNILTLLFGGISITDENGIIRYKVQRLGLFSNSWRIMKKLKKVATISRRTLSWSLTWDVHSDIGSFIVKRKVVSWGHSYYLVGSVYGGTTITSNLLSSNFEIEQSGKLFATAYRKFFTLRDRHVIEMIDTSIDAELLVVIFMTAMQLDRKRERDSNGTSN